jgi:hypothetical protein
MGFVSRAAASITVVLAAGAAWAGASCVPPEDFAALKTAALQQYLMVAALTCHDAPAYNSFVLDHRGELQESDRMLLRFFMRRNSGTGDGDYNAYKTWLANVVALRSVRDGRFCEAADAAFADANDGRRLGTVVAGQPLPIDVGDVSCVLTPSGSQVASVTSQLRALPDGR